MTKLRKQHDWASIRNLAVARGYDPAYAAWIADQWEKRQEKKKNNLTPPAEVGNEIAPE